MQPCLIFDYDGVIANSKEAWLHSFKRAMERLGYKAEISQAEFLKKAGPKTKETIESFLPEKDKHKGAEGKEIIDEIVSTEGVEKATLCSNVTTMLSKLKKAGYSINLLTNSDAAFVYPGLKKFRLDRGVFDLVITADDPFQKKEAAIEFIATANEVETRDCIYVADRPHDAEIAHNVGAKIIGISNATAWATESEMKKAKPDFLIHDLAELPALLEKSFKRD